MFDRVVYRKVTKGLKVSKQSVCRIQKLYLIGKGRSALWFELNRRRFKKNPYEITWIKVIISKRSTSNPLRSWDCETWK